jgi:hypothetical protein
MTNKVKDVAILKGTVILEGEEFPAFECSLNSDKGNFEASVIIQKRDGTAINTRFVDLVMEVYSRGWAKVALAFKDDYRSEDYIIENLMFSHRFPDNPYDIMTGFTLAGTIAKGHEASINEHYLQTIL